MSGDRLSFAVVGAGISGLAAAWELSRHGGVTVYDPAPPGGKLTTAIFEGRNVELGPDAFLTRVPEALDLCAQLGLSGELVAPTTGAAMLWNAGGLEAMPSGLVLGVPRHPLAVMSVLGPLGAARAAADWLLPPTAGQRGEADVSVYDLVAGRLGRKVASRLVDPLVGGIHAGRTEELSARATTPQLLAAAQRSRSLMRALRQVPESAVGPVFLAPRQGFGHLVERLVASLVGRGVVFRTVPVDAVEVRDDHRLLVRTGPARARAEADGDEHDGAVLAIPSAGAAEILGERAPSRLAGIPTASVALLVMSFEGRDLTTPRGMSGMLVPKSTGRLMTACSFASTKWPHWAEPGTTLLRVSTGRAGDDRAMAMGDAELVERLGSEIGEALGVRATPRNVCVTRWPDAFPQYRVGHLDRVTTIEEKMAHLAAPVALAGASYRGAGIPACIGSGRRAAATVLGRFSQGWSAA